MKLDLTGKVVVKRMPSVPYSKPLPQRHVARRRRASRPSTTALLDGACLRKVECSAELYARAEANQIGAIYREIDVLRVDHGSLNPALYRLKKNGWIMPGNGCLTVTAKPSTID
ncbi:MAG: hypothetical protein C5B57_02480 [Blastocatellia bacterium]|nr:MAG: hypothetical protein C5B57_02480 [Blastocatellia bacterium]